MFTLKEGEELIRLARHSIETLLFNKPLDISYYKKFNQKMGVYVTLRKNNKLRGQMGNIKPNEELYKSVVKAARDAAFRDKRFDAIKKEEMEEISIEVAIVINPKLLRVTRPEDFSKYIHPQTDGLMIKSGVYSAVILPNPEMTYGWSAERLLRHLCIAAGMTMDAWKDLNDNIYVFQCQIFAERNGKIVEVV